MRVYFPRLLCLGVVALCATDAFAVRWQLTPGVGLSEYYSDNVRLEQPGQEMSAFITSVNPGFNLNGNGQRVNIRSNYSMQNYFYHSEGEDIDDVRYHTGALSGEFKAMQERFNLGLGSTYSQQTIDPQEVRQQQEFNLGAEVQNFYTLRFAPRLRQEVGSFFVSELNYQWDHIEFIDDVFFESRNFASIALNSPDPRARIQYGTIYRYEKRSYQFGGGFTIQNVDLHGAYQFTPRLTGSASIGYDKNESVEALLVDDEGIIWGLGLDWRPINRIRLEMHIGEQFYGQNYSLNYNHRLRRMIWNLRLVRELFRFESNILEQNILGPDPNNNNNPLPVPIVVDPEDQTEIQLRNRADLNLTFNARRNSMSIGAYVDYRDYLTDDRKTDQDQFMGASLSYTFRFSQKASLTLSSNFERLREVRAAAVDERDTTYVRTSINFTRQIRSRLTFNTSWTRNEGLEVGNFEYAENVGVIDIRMQF